MIRTAVESYSLLPAIRQAIWSVNPNQAVARVRTMDEIIAAELTVPRRSSAFLSAFSGLALLLASLGIYGVLSYAVARRTTEIGVRMALGASRESIALLVARRGIVLTTTGLTIGLLLSVPTVRLMSRLLYEAPEVDWVTPLASAVVLLFVAVLAVSLPARRAASLDPAVTLRSE